ncbi:hypothetical protein [Maliponia aquimaris]|nr:hypothetical protein [Maliponia aquimaris]
MTDMQDHDTADKARQIAALARFGGFIALDDLGYPVQLIDFLSHFEVIERLAREIVTELDGLES